MGFSEELTSALVEAGVETPNLPGDAQERLNRLAHYCPVYRDFLLRHPLYALWLEESENRTEGYRRYAFESEMRRTLELEDVSLAEPKDHLRKMQRYRRKMSMRIAYREINGMSTIEDSFRELSLLADCCVQAIYEMCRRSWEKRLGTPWNEEFDRPAQFCVLALGKLGGEELNFCSDLDLIYFYDKDGFCRRKGKKTQLTNGEFFGRMARDLTNLLQQRSEEGFLFNIDLRLRPEGDSGPLLRTLAGMETYYYTAGQTWERLAHIRTRPTAGDEELAHELFETLNSFRYPRSASPSVIAEVGGVKIRTEKEALGEGNIERDIKTGRGGIREIEFFVQTLQFLNGGKNPFLQTNSTLEAMDCLTRYELIEHPEYRFLKESYLFLRQVEHRLQMRDERQTHRLPESDEDWADLAESLGAESADKLKERIETTRTKVRGIYRTLFPETSYEEQVQAWTVFFTGGKPSPEIEERLEYWFQRDWEEVAPRLRRMVMGSTRSLLTREQVVLFLELSKSFDELLPHLAFPMTVLERVADFGKSYGAPRQFLKMCNIRPGFFKSLSTVFDESDFIFKLVCRHPEIVEEIFYSGLRLHKDPEVITSELEALPDGDDDAFADAIWLYVRAEQVRVAISEVLAGSQAAATERDLTRLAERTIDHVLHRVDPEGELVCVAVGKLGGEEAGFGSDLDLIVLGSDGNRENQQKKLQHFLRIMRRRPTKEPIYEIDLRLRPFGEDGPLITTVPAMRKYHQKNAWNWEKQMLTRARPLPRLKKRHHTAEQIACDFVRFRDDLLFEGPCSEEQVVSLENMLRRIEKEKVRLSPPERAFKAAKGGLVELEFVTQLLQLRFGFEEPDLRSQNTRRNLHAATRSGHLPQEKGVRLLDNYNFLRTVEHILRRRTNTASSEISEDPREQRALARWLGFKDYADFWEDHVGRMHHTHRITAELFESCRQASPSP